MSEIARTIQDAARVAALRSLQLLDTLPDEAFDRLTRLASRMLPAPIALVNLVDSERQFFKSAVGMGDLRELPIGTGVCSYAVASREPLVIADARLDPRFSTNPIVTDYGLVAYIGIPLITADEHALGTLCVVDPEPRAWREEDLETMRDLAAIVVTEMDLRSATLALEQKAGEAEAAHAVADEARRNVQELLEGLDAVVWEADAATGKFSFVNRRAEDILGYPVEQWLEDPAFWQTFVHPEEQERVSGVGRAASAAGRDFQVEYRAVAADGRTRWLSDRVRVFSDAEGRPHRWRGVMTDVTTRRESETSYRSLFDSLEELVYVLDLDGYILNVNEAVLRRLGYTREEVVGMEPAELVDPARADSEAFGARWRQALAGDSQRFETWGLTKGGESFSEEVTFVRGEYFGAPVVIAVVRDVSERKRNEIALIQAEAHYRRLVETSPDGIFVLDVEGRITELNDAASRMFGTEVDKSGYLGRHFSEFIAAEDVPKKMAAQQAKLSGKARVTNTDLRVHTASGEERIVRFRSTLIKDDGRVSGTHGILRDITEERARERTMRLLTAALDSFNEGVSLTTSDDEVLYANPALTRILGIETEAQRELDVQRILPDDASREQYREMLTTLATEGRWSGRAWRRRLSDGQIIPVDLIAGAVEAPDGERNLFFVLHEATDSIEREIRIRRIERLASVGTLIGGVAHELNNPLHAIRSFAELMLLDERDPEDRESLTIMKCEADRAAKIVADLRMIARDTQAERSQRMAVDLNDVVGHVRKLRRYSLETGNVELREDLAHDLPPVLANRSEIEQVVLNLVVNAEQAMAGQVGDRRLILRTRRTARGATLHVVDSGPGIPVEHLDWIWDPFFTTKPPGEGTGLGLSLVHGIIAEHGGEIHVESEPGQGTTFRVDLPPAPAADGSAPPDAVEEAPARSLRILVVDDEDAVRRVSVRFLERTGHRVDSAADGMEALRLLNDTDYDAIISDLRMPGLSGEELFARLREQGRGEERKVIFMTGDAASTQGAEALSSTNAPVLIKPVRLQDLARAIESMASERESGRE